MSQFESAHLSIGYRMNRRQQRTAGWTGTLLLIGVVAVVGVASPLFDFPKGTVVWFALRISLTAAP